MADLPAENTFGSRNGLSYLGWIVHMLDECR